MSGVKGNEIMSGYGDENPDDEGREAARDNTKSASRGADAQCYRIKARVNQQGVKGVIHGNRGRLCKRKAKEKTVNADSGILTSRGCPMDSLNCHGGLLPRSCYRKWNECILNGKDWDVVEATHQAYRSEISKIAKR